MHTNRLAFPWRTATSVLAATAVALFGSSLGVRPATAQATFGTLSNFDVFNDTGQDCHGFEIELDGISSSNVTYTFGAPYERYGNPHVVDDIPGNRVFVRYESPYNTSTQKFTETTPQAPSPITPTAGHACWTGGLGAAAYQTAGCEHFGLGLTANPTNVVYRWLVEDLANPGHLTPLGTKVSIPAPIWNVVPPPVVGQPPVVQAVIPAEPPEVETECDDAQWVKVFVTESEAAPELADLVSSDPNNVVPGETETETEWALLQHCPGEVDDELLEEQELGEGNKAVTRRYEVYKYTGAYSAEHEALCGDPTVEDLANCGPFVDGLNGVGDYIGAQMAAIDLVLGPLGLVASPLPAGEHNLRYSTALITGGTPPYTVSVLKGAFPSGLDVHDLNSGFLSGTPDGPAKTSTVKLQVTDGLGASVTSTVKVKIVKEVHIATGSLKTGKKDKSYKVKLKASGGQAPYNWSLVGGTLPDGLTLDSAAGVITGVPTIVGMSPLTFQVTDDLGGVDPQDLKLEIK